MRFSKEEWKKEFEAGNTNMSYWQWKLQCELYHDHPEWCSTTLGRD